MRMKGLPVFILLFFMVSTQAVAQTSLPIAQQGAVVRVDSLSFQEPVSAARLKYQQRLKIVGPDGSELETPRIASFKVQLVAKAVHQSFEIQGNSLDPIRDYLKILVAGDVIVITNILAVNGKETMYLNNMSAQLTE